LVRRTTDFVLSVWVFVLSVAVRSVVLNDSLAWSSGTIFIRADGSIDPPTTPITTLDKVTYAFTNNIHDSIVVERDNIVVDGAGYTVQGSGGGTGITLTSRNNATIKRTNIKGFDTGIFLYSTYNSTIAKNNITSNKNGIIISYPSEPVPPGPGVPIYPGKNRVIVNNITANDESGITLGATMNNSVCANDLAKNDIGVRLLYCGYNNVYANNVANNRLGILSKDSFGGNLYANNITENREYGVRLNNCTNHFIHHNNFIRNTHQVHIEYSFSPNVWDDDYPSGGNYWSDYAGVDEKSGLNQDQLGSDGMGDTPYIVDANNRDRYPLMNPNTSRFWPKPPTTTHDYDGSWHTADFAITLSATAEYGVAVTYCKINNLPPQASSQPRITTESDNNTLEFWSIDSFGYEELQHKILTGIKLDKTAPVGSITINGGAASTTSTSVTFTLSATDDTSGVAQMRFSNDNVAWTNWEAYAASKAWTLTLGDGSRTVFVQFMDNAGLVSTTYSATINLSTLPPPFEAFPMWVVAASFATGAIVGAVTAVFWRKRKQHPTIE